MNETPTPYQLTDSDGRLFRWIFLAGTVLYPLYWFVQTRVQGMADPLLLRLAVTGPIFLAFVGMFKSEWVRRHSLLVAVFVLWVMTNHLLFLTWLNGVPTAYIVGLIIVICVATLVGTYSRAMVRLVQLYYLSNLVGASAVALSVEDPIVNPYSFLLGVVTVQLVGYGVLVVRIRMMERLTTSQSRYELAALGARDGLWDWDLLSESIYYSPRWRSMMGYPPEAEVSALDDWLSRVHADDRQRVRGELMAHVEGESLHFESDYRISLPAGERWMLGRGLARRDDAGKAYRMAGSQTDITETKQTERRLQLLNDELARARDLALNASDNKTSFLAQMSHELRTPLNAIIGYSEILEEDMGERSCGDMQPDVRKINVAAHHLLGLINNILDLSKIEAGIMQLDEETFEITELLENIEATTRSLADKGRNRLLIKKDDGLDRIRGDRTRLQQVLINLLSNACKFTRDGSVELRVFKEDGMLAFDVSDTGHGIAPDKLDRVFEPFVQVNDANSNFKGTGLGLAITRRFCRLMGGDVRVESRLGKGSKFCVRLPELKRRNAEP